MQLLKTTTLNYKYSREPDLFQSQCCCWQLPRYLITLTLQDQSFECCFSFYIKRWRFSAGGKWSRRTREELWWRNRWAACTWRAWTASSHRCRVHPPAPAIPEHHSTRLYNLLLLHSGWTGNPVISELHMKQCSPCKYTAALTLFWSITSTMVTSLPSWGPKAT